MHTKCMKSLNKIEELDKHQYKLRNLHFERLKCKRQIFNPVQSFIMHIKMQVTKFIKQYSLEFFEAFFEAKYLDKSLNEINNGINSVQSEMKY